MIESQKLILVPILGVCAYLLLKPKKKVNVKYAQVAGTMTSIQLAENYKELVSSSVRMFINPTDENDPETGTAWAEYLAEFTKDFEAVKKVYQQYYSKDLSADLISWFSGIELSKYVALLYEKNKQVMS